MMTLEEAANSIGATVIYWRPGTPKEEGEITGTSSTMVFVRYRGDTLSKATYAADLAFAFPAVWKPDA